MIDELKLIEDNKNIYKIALKNDIEILDEPFESIVQELIIYYEGLIVNDIKAVFKTHQMQYNLFDSIYHMNIECDYDNSNATYVGDSIF